MTGHTAQGNPESRLAHLEAAISKAVETITTLEQSLLDLSRRLAGVEGAKADTPKSASRRAE